MKMTQSNALEMGMLVTPGLGQQQEQLEGLRMRTLFLIFISPQA